MENKRPLTIYHILSLTEGAIVGLVLRKLNWDSEDNQLVKDMAEAKVDCKDLERRYLGTRYCAIIEGQFVPRGKINQN